MVDIATLHPERTLTGWEQFEHRARGVVPALLLFAAAYVPMVFLDHALREAPAAATVLRPSIGLLLVVIWFSRPSRWPAFLAIHVIAVLLAERWWGEPMDGAMALSIALLPGAVVAMVAALVCRHLLRKPLEVQVTQVPWAMVGVVGGALCGAATATLIKMAGTQHSVPLWEDFSQHAVEYALGALTTGPIALTWLHREHLGFPILAPRSRRELALLCIWVMLPIVMGWYFLRGASSSLLPIPLAVGPALVVASLRLPPRWAVTLAALFVLPFTLLATARAAPYSVADPAVRIGLLQMLVGIFVVVPFILSVGIAQLRMTMSRLRVYAQRVSVAEEKARRSTAVDLHDGIGQTIAGMQMMIDAARHRPPADPEPLLAELALCLRGIQEHTRRMIADLSPPGLYDLGLGAGLKWLVLHVHDHDGLIVKLTCEVDEDALPERVRVLVFKIAKELLRNVVRHSGVRIARIEAFGDGRSLRLIVSDSGRGFVPRLPGALPGNGFGLWSIAERVRESGGQFRIHAAPGTEQGSSWNFPWSRVEPTRDCSTGLRPAIPPRPAAAAHIAPHP